MKTSLREKRRTERRFAILAVARDYFFEHGYGAATMSGIAAKLGGSKETLWRHFPSKEELFAAVIEFTTAEFRSQMLATLPPPTDDPLETLTRLCRSVIEQAVSPPAIALFRLINSEAGRFPDVGRIFYERGPTKTQRVIGDYLAEHLGSVLRDTDLVRAGRVLFALCSAGIYYEQIWAVGTTATPEDKDADARTAAEVFWRAYRADAKDGSRREAA
jgi:AcrR family transcriptional regulator